ncbi:aspartate 1-decarboxylase [Opitutales bacterium ASA1]|nr:aspartate 1-decarboxylase [Opitutales bacterium ASA1]
MIVVGSSSSESLAMRVTLLKAKLHRATVTGADLDYEGSIAIGPELIEAAGLLPFERVDVYNVTTGARFSTYVIIGTERGQIMLNGAAARLVQRGDEVIIAAYAEFEPEEARRYRPTVVLLDRENRPLEAASAGVSHDSGAN